VKRRVDPFANQPLPALVESQLGFDMRMAHIFVASALAGCASVEPAPVEFRTGAPQPESGVDAPMQPPKTAAQSAPPPRTPPAPVEFRRAPAGAGREDDRSAFAALPPLPEPASAEPASEPAPDWAARPGQSLSDFALRPEDVRPFDPKSPPQEHTVKAGETVYSLSALYQAPMRALIEINALQPPFALEPGTVLKVPRPRLHRVRPGETLLTLARTYSVDVRSLALLNGLKPPYTVGVDDRILLPMDARSRDVRVQSTAARTPDAEPSPGAATPAERPGGAFAWPVQGAILTPFGPGPNGRRLDGVDIAAPEGAAIAAAASGRVAYAGAELAGYGHLVLVQHPGGWITAYARAGKLEVAEGDVVRRGQILGTVGRVGPGPTRLHFQIRQGRRAQDPQQLLPPLR
jgi:murein DD-endopeptidase MepM/ murein hydrolase activator NlpD